MKEVSFSHQLTLYSVIYIEYDLPKLDWLSVILADRPELIFESLVNEALRLPGNKVVWHDHFKPMSLSHASGTNALRWNSNGHPDRGPPDSEVRWFHARSDFHPTELLDWTNEVNKVGRLAEILIVDDDLDVVATGCRSFPQEGKQTRKTAIRGEYTSC